MFYDCPFQTCDQDKEFILVHSKNTLYLFLDDQTLHFFSAGADMYPQHIAQAYGCLKHLLNPTKRFECVCLVIIRLYGTNVLGQQRTTWKW
jgi:hypothetical protein